MFSASEREVKVWDLESGIEVLACGHTGYVFALVVTPDGRHAISASEDETLKVWNLKTLREVLTLAGHEGMYGYPTGVAVTRDGQLAVSCSDDYTLKVWRLNGVTRVSKARPALAKLLRGRSTDESRDGILHTLRGHSKGVRVVAVTPDGSCAISGSNDNTVRVWDLLTGTQRHVLHGHANGITMVTLTPDGRRIVSASYDHTIRVWDVERGTAVLVLSGHTNWVNAVAIAPTGQFVVSVSQDCNLYIWDLNNGAVLAHFTSESPIVNCAIAPDSKTIVVGESSGAVHFLLLEGV